MLPSSSPTGWQEAGSGPNLDQPRGSLADREGRKRWGEYKTEEPHAHGSFGQTDGFSRFRQNVDMCHPRESKKEFDEGCGHMYPRALVKFNMNDEALVECNHNRRLKQNKVFEVFPLNDPDRIDDQGNKVLTTATREGLASNTQRFYQSTRNERIYTDHTAEIRRRVAEKLKKKRYEELKEALRLLAFLEPTPENWAQYREICELEIDYDGEVIHSKQDTKEKFMNRLEQNFAAGSKDEGSKTEDFSGSHAESGNNAVYDPWEYKSSLGGILRESRHETNQFVRPWADPKLVFALATWEPNRKCHPRACRRVRFKDEIYDVYEETDFGLISSETENAEPPANETKKKRELEEPENLYYDTAVCTNIASRLGIRFKTEACKRFHRKYKDPLPDLRTYHTYGKKHFFNGFHTSAFRG